MDPWPMIEADRRALAVYLSKLTDDEWSRQSLSADWSVADVVAHMLVIPTVPKRTIFFGFLRSGFNLDRFSAKMVARLRAEHTEERMAEVMAESADSRSVPPGLQPMGVLAEVLVHAGDISEGVGRPLAFPTAHYVAGLGFLKDMQSAYGCKERIAGLRLSATDANWTHGDGPEVEGTAQHLALAMTGRRAAVEHLGGDGVETLRSRC